MSRILLLGGTGFIGTAVAACLRASGDSVTTVGTSRRADLHLDLAAAKDLASVVAGFELVINLVGAGLAAGTVDGRTMAAANSLLPARIADVLQGVPLLHAASSTEPESIGQEYESEYSRTKHAGTLALLDRMASGLPITLLRIYNVYGPGQPRERFVAGTIAALRAGEQITLQFPERVRDFVFIDDVCATIAVAVRQRLRADPVPVVEVGTGTGLALIEVARRVARAVGAPESLVAAASRPDPHPSTVCPVPYGTLGLCRTAFDEGLARTLEVG